MIKVLNINDKDYPQKLRNIVNPPQKLFYKGNIKLLNEPMIAVIGSRDITEYGKRYGRIIVKNLALRDITIVSGMAVGADRIAHEETLNVGGKTIAVMGTGFREYLSKSE